MDRMPYAVSRHLAAELPARGTSRVHVIVEDGMPVRPAVTRGIRRRRARAVWAPIVLLECYLTFTVLVYFFGPVEWRVPSGAKLLLFLVCNYGGLWLGYSWGIRRGAAALRRSRVGEVGVVRMPSHVGWLILFSMVFTIVADIARLYAITGDAGMFIASFMNPGEAYRKAQTIAQMDRDGELLSLGAYAWAFRISTVLGVFNGLYFPLSLACWRRLNGLTKALFFVTLICAVVFTVGMGAQSGIGLLVFASLPVVLYRVYVAARPITSPSAMSAVRTRRRRAHPAMAKLVAAASLCALVGTVAFFQWSRAEDSGRELNAAADLGGPYASASERGVFRITGGRLNYGIVMASLYVSHGYQGLALAMELPFEPTYGLGWSRALQVIVRDYLGGPDLVPRSYLVRNSLEQGWPTAWWSTIFAWIASDTTFYGTALVLVLLGFVIGRCWMHVVLTGNPIGFAVLAQLFTLVFMFPANNALAQTLEAFFSLLGVTILYVLSRSHMASARRRSAVGIAAASRLATGLGRGPDVREA